MSCFPVYILVRTDLGTGSKCSYTVADGSFEFIRQGSHKVTDYLTESTTLLGNMQGPSTRHR